jgi:hypothetical protein
MGHRALRLKAKSSSPSFVGIEHRAESIEFKNEKAPLPLY